MNRKGLTYKQENLIDSIQAVSKTVADYSENVGNYETHKQIDNLKTIYVDPMKLHIKNIQELLVELQNTIIEQEEEW